MLKAVHPAMDITVSSLTEELRDKKEQHLGHSLSADQWPLNEIIDMAMIARVWELYSA